MLGAGFGWARDWVRDTRAACASQREWIVLMLVIFAYLVGYGPGVVTSVVVLITGDQSAVDTQSMSGAAAFAIESGLIGIGLLLGAAATRLISSAALREWLSGQPPRRPGRGMLIAGLVLGSHLAGYWLYVWLFHPRPPAHDPATPALWLDAAQSTVAGAIGEEFIVLALPIVVARWLAPRLLRPGRPAVMFVAVLVIGRMAYHLYQGAAAWSHLPWAVVAILLYMRWGRVWPQILAHAFYDLTLVLAQHHRISQLSEMLLHNGAVVLLISAGALVTLRTRAPARNSMESRPSPRDDGRRDER